MGVAGCSRRLSDAVAAWFLQMVLEPGASSLATCRSLDIVPIRVAVRRSNSRTNASRRSPLDSTVLDDEPVCEIGLRFVAARETNTTRGGRGSAASWRRP
jgi:hypothetical protein